jgi:hypothetical protein
MCVYLNPASDAMLLHHMPLLFMTTHPCRGDLGESNADIWRNEGEVDSEGDGEGNSRRQSRVSAGCPDQPVDAWLAPWLDRFKGE